MKSLATPHEVAKIICELDRDDPNFEMQVANIVKGYGHGVHADEWMMLKYRMVLDKRKIITVSELMEFRNARIKKHGNACNFWFTKEYDSWRLKHFYGNPEQDPCSEKCSNIVDGKCDCWRTKHYEG